MGQFGIRGNATKKHNQYDRFPNVPAMIGPGNGELSVHYLEEAR